MYDCGKKLRNFHDENVSLSKHQQDEMRTRRDTNRKKLTGGLKISIEYMKSQGSYAMYTMVQDKDNDYDIDDGVVFLNKTLESTNIEGSSENTTESIKKMVRDAVDDGSFNKPPEVRKNCVRVYYEKGYHVDLPVYKKLDDGKLELASEYWKESDPTSVTIWFNKEVKEKSPDTEVGKRQLARIVKLIKCYKGSRKEWKSQMASGFIISVLVVECYVSDDRDDVAFYKTIKAINKRLEDNLVVNHPTISNETLTISRSDSKTIFLKDKLGEAIEHLGVLLNTACDEEGALRAWYEVFQHQYWKVIKEETSEKEIKTEKITFKGFEAKARKPYFCDGTFKATLKSIILTDGVEMEVKKFFPELVFKNSEVIEGKIGIHAEYYQSSKDGWWIKTCDSENDNNSKCFKGIYHIKICLKSKPPTVYETSSKIENLANELGKPFEDLHIYEKGKCCLTCYVGNDLPLIEFLKNIVYPYFAWQAYYEKFRKIPPVGEYSHGDEGRKECLKELEKLRRNDTCICGSGKKFKNCCINKNNLIKKRIANTQLFPNKFF